MKQKSVYLVLVLALALGGCAGKASLPAITSEDSESELVGKFVWRDLLTENPEGVERFYGELFGWTFQTTEMPQYKLILHRDRPIAGMVSTGEETKQINESQWVSLLSVANVDDAVKQVRGARGEVLMRQRCNLLDGRISVRTISIWIVGEADLESYQKTRCQSAWRSGFRGTTNRPLNVRQKRKD